MEGDSVDMTDAMHDPKLGMEKLALKDISGTIDWIEMWTID